jgi:hypothetical protein
VIALNRFQRSQLPSGSCKSDPRLVVSYSLISLLIVTLSLGLSMPDIYLSFEDTRFAAVLHSKGEISKGSFLFV